MKIRLKPGNLFFDFKLIEQSIKLATLFVCAVASGSHAMQPLSAFLRGASQSNYDNREARAMAAQRIQEAGQAWARLLPSVMMQSDFIRNQYPGAAELPTGTAADGVPLPTRSVVISPEHQRDVSVTATMPLLDIAVWNQISAATATQEAEKARVATTVLDVQKTVAQTYYRLVGASVVAQAARRTLAAAEDNAHYVGTRVGAGLASELDLKRAQVEVERDRQAIEDAYYSTIIQWRSLQTLTGLTPEADTAKEDSLLPEDDLREEPPLERWNFSLGDLPSVRAAEHDRIAAERSASSSLAALYPAVSASFSERATNAAGFGRSPAYAAQVLATWKLDAATFKGARAQRCAAEASALRTERSRTEAADAIFDAWHLVRTQIAKSRAARSSRESSRLALSVAREKYGSGLANLLDVVQAERDAFSAEVANIQAEADLASARASLRLSAGRTLEMK